MRATISGILASDCRLRCGAETCEDPVDCVLRILAGRSSEISLRHFNFAVTEPKLNLPDVGTVLQRPCRERVSETVQEPLCAILSLALAALAISAIQASFTCHLLADFQEMRVW